MTDQNTKYLHTIIDGALYFCHRPAWATAASISTMDCMPVSVSACFTSEDGKEEHRKMEKVTFAYEYKSPWELRADLEAEERRARQIRQADALTEMARADEDAGLLDD